MRIIMKKFLLIALVAGLALPVFSQTTLKKSKSSSSSGRTYYLTVNPNVGSASVWIDGELKGTGRVRAQVSRGRHEIIVKASGYSDYKTVTNVTRNFSMNVNLKKGAGSAAPEPKPAATVFKVQVNSNVKGAKIFVDDNFSGNTPQNVLMTPGNHSLKVSSSGYNDYTASINVTRNTTINTILEQPNLTLVVNANVSGAAVYIDGKKMGTTNGTFSILRGSHQIKVTAAGYEDFQTSVNLQSNNTVVNANMQRPFYTLRVNSNVSGATVFIDGNDMGAAQTSYSMQGGNHDIRVVASGYQDFTTSLDLKKNNTIINARLEPLMAQVQIVFPESTSSSRSPQKMVWIDGNLVSEDFTIAPGVHTVTIQYGDLTTSQQFDFTYGPKSIGIQMSLFQQ